MLIPDLQRAGRWYQVGYLRVLYGAVGTVAGVMLGVALLSECGECRVGTAIARSAQLLRLGAFGSLKSFTRYSSIEKGTLGGL